MLVFGSSILSSPVMSLQTGRAIAFCNDPVIDPRDLSVKAYWVNETQKNKNKKLLRVQDSREYSKVGFILDSADELIEAGDVIEIDRLIKFDFKIIGMSVHDESGAKLGKVDDYSIDTENFLIIQIKVKSSIIKSINQTGYLINRSQIIEVSDDKITVKSTGESEQTKNKFERVAYINPFATSNPQPEVSEFSE